MTNRCTYMPGTTPELSRTATYYKTVEIISIPCSVCGAGILPSQSKVIMGERMAHLKCCTIKYAPSDKYERDPGLEYKSTTMCP